VTPARDNNGYDEEAIGKQTEMQLLNRKTKTIEMESG
jgi:hypothetical protein